MKQDNPFAKLGAIDQKLYHETAPKPLEKTGEHASKPESQKSRMRANWQTRLLALQKASKLALLTFPITPLLQKK